MVEGRGEPMTPPALHLALHAPRRFDRGPRFSCRSQYPTGSTRYVLDTMYLGDSPGASQSEKWVSAQAPRCPGVASAAPNLQTPPSDVNTPPWKLP
ncbi:uncharacterized protein B0I36DRAFT_323410 [Microdochium trichocladiopsis]|uniref:Uncharacterized protein n=1 Tax=Microdochium trichocladiopsis TaxID=1682393 RepID=A0A9P9BU84_9PEZI|nr:uncharacterized protein B0I36DRAFT_323410 [Microdochium trichocladiopsis]KAH7031204.1 hypothetical protein B0I36DRAFT_323410 [Microdochium trichocladiopsis]